MIKQTIKFQNFLGEEREETHHFHVKRSNVMLQSDEQYDKLLNLGKELQDLIPEIEARQKAVEETGGEAVNDPDPFSEDGKMLAKSGRKMMALLDLIVGMSYGVLSDDGNSFVQNEEVVNTFKSSAAYEGMMMQFLNNPDQLETFIKELL